MTYKFIPHDAPPDAKGLRFRCGTDKRGYLVVELLNIDGEWREAWRVSPSGFPSEGSLAFTMPRLDKLEFPMEGTP